MSSDGIDVIIPVFNGARYLEQALRSVQAQTLPPARIIIADDGSRDGTPDLARRLQAEDDRILYLRLPHAGVSAARNAGIGASTAAFIAFLDADDIWLPEKLERQMEAFVRGGPRTGFVHSSYFNIDAAGRRLTGAPVFPPRQRGDIFLPLLLEGYALSGSASSVLVRRAVLDQAGAFDERLFHGEDWDLWIRLARIAEVDFTPAAVVGIRIHGESAQRRVVPRQALSFFRQHLIIYSKWHDLCSADARFMAALRKRAVCTALPTLRNPAEANGFYSAIAKGEDRLGQALFRHRLHFWFEVFLEVLRYLEERLKWKNNVTPR